MAPEDAVRWITEAAATGYLGSVLLFGGEPMLAPDTVLAGVEAVVDVGVPRVDVITNAFWATSDSVAQEWVDRLSVAGLRRITISVDAFHAEFTPMERVRFAGVAARAAGMEVTWNVSLLQKKSPTHPDDLQTLQMAESVRCISDDVHLNAVLPAGRALQSFASLYIRRPGLPPGPCPGPSYATDLAAPTVYTVGPAGEVSICWGMVVGHARHRSLADVVADYDPATSTIASTLLSSGPSGLLSLPAAAGFHPQAGYVDECELCREIMPYLRRPEQIA